MLLLICSFNNKTTFYKYILRPKKFFILKAEATEFFKINLKNFLNKYNAKIK